MKKTQKQFGGDWTAEKLQRVRKYLVAYATIMNKKHFRFAYIDAFAGTGYRTLKENEDQNELMFPEILEEESQQFLKGSARIALQVEPRFTKYIFIEKEETRFAELQRLKADFPSVQNDIILVNTDANAYIKDLCHNYTWNTNRAVFFLDPFGMQVEWDTIIAIAETRAIDLWILFPLGVAVNRLLKKDGNINESIRKRLDTIFGASDWYNAFYQTRTDANLFGEQSYIEKVGNFDSIGHYFVDRLKTVFAGVANNPLPLLNTRNIPLYLLCFASGNQRGAEIAVRIAEHILGR